MQGYHKYQGTYISAVVLGQTTSITLNRVTTPLTHIINASIVSGEVPTSWKEAIIVPILKKGSATEKVTTGQLAAWSQPQKFWKKLFVIR